jgi:hypothetical protein
MSMCVFDVLMLQTWLESPRLMLETCDSSLHCDLKHIRLIVILS